MTRFVDDDEHRGGDELPFVPPNPALPQPAPAERPPGTPVPAEPDAVSTWGIVLLVAATFGSGMAMIVPMAYSLAVRLDELAPGRTDLLGYLLGIGSAATL
ncbi:MAG: hypothetical protein K0S37_3852, partial [Microbacterium sp.]|nr:hypothetical protein [Microbacterium sp.]